ncbi:unnamed protein product [Cuscuta epithymum]|uniref:Uncharacterized protein n=1 Tax=Cuscuta epithymum TaxID=186058 RepID=A0AAV0GJU5_9ASTE|nr:unnamed protein product [Cuscuta epithymum]
MVFLESQPLTLTEFGKDRRPPTLDRRRPPTVAACGTRGRNQPSVGQTGRQAARQDGRRPPAGPPAAAGIRRDPICQRKDGRRPFVTEGGRPLWPPTADGTGHDPLSATGRKAAGERRKAAAWLAAYGKIFPINCPIFAELKHTIFKPISDQKGRLLPPQSSDFHHCCTFNFNLSYLSHFSSKL